MIKILTTLKEKKLFIMSLFLIIILFLIDIYTKRLAFSKVGEIYEKTAGIHQHIEITPFFNIVRVLNYGVSFGMFNNIQYGSIIISIVTAIILIYVIYLNWKAKTRYEMTAYSLIISGGLGNLYDRITQGAVYDFLDFHIAGYHWPSFNIADSLICIAVAMIILKDIVFYFKNKKNINK